MARYRTLALILFLLVVATVTTGCGETTVHVALPEDDAPHDDVMMEWWYYNGHLEAASGERYAFHYVVFQVLIPTHQVVNVAHLSISNPQNDTYLIDQRMTLGYPTSQEAPGFAFELDGWTMSGYDGRDELSAFAHDCALNLTLQQVKRPVLHERTGLVSLGEAVESYYYSRTRLAATGTVSIRGTELPVTGLAWFDHQWGDFDPRPIRWDWFALQLSDGTDVMLSCVRDETDEPSSRYGTFVTADGAASNLAMDEFQISETRSWKSPVSGAVYPAGWQVSIPARDVDVTLMPVIDRCEFDATSTTQNYYWEGEVTVSGGHDGTGFAELTGYAGS